ncbi:MUS81 [Cordylochernes scorpioides]|uniref:Crossover junction endonuclease MUS81 n=1 Tax=Cordylochernes scorpioides TaxID=51811 RepID=A0ABY6LTD1_9ARAC|nr:MUS81 [Cordylochernes scorpioides]
MKKYIRIIIIDFSERMIPYYLSVFYPVTGAANRSKNKQGSRRQVNHVLSSSEDESSTLVEHTSQERRAPLSQIFTLNMNNLDSVHASSQHWESSQEDGPHFCLQPGSFSVVLCVDCAETTSGNARSRKANLLPELRIQNVPVDVRKLHVGDFVWVARENVRYQRGQSIAPPRELVFDFVVERKRIDDLSHSIMDGRFHEQKSRLKECGLRKPVYLVEEFKLHFLSVPRETLEQAISNTQFIDEFEVIRTNCLKETVQYLSLMTRYLQTTFENQTLYSRPRDMEDPPSSYHLVPFDIFNKGSIKNKPLTVQEMFCKQLCQLSGLSVEKVLAIAQIYPTPSSLFEAYMKCATEEEKEKLLVNIKYGSAQR